MKLKVFSIIAVLSLIIVHQAAAQLGIDFSNITKDNIFQELFSPAMSAIVILLGLVSKYIPKLKDLNKAALTLITSVVLGIIAIAFYGMSIEKAVLSVLFAVMAYNNVIKQAISEPMVNE